MELSSMSTGVLFMLWKNEQGIHHNAWLEKTMLKAGYMIALVRVYKKSGHEMQSEQINFHIQNEFVSSVTRSLGVGLV